MVSKDINSGFIIFFLFFLTYCPLVLNESVKVKAHARFSKSIGGTNLERGITFVNIELTQIN